MLEPLNFLSVCSGIEAASVAWEPMGWRASAVSEIDPFPCHVLAHRWGAGRPLFMPDPEAPGLSLKDRRSRAAAIKAMATVPEGGRIPNLGDMTQFKEWPDFGTTELLVGGTPCQSFSVAGLRKGLDDPRGNLALTYLALADRYRPEWVVWENVPGVLSSNGGRDFGAFLGGLVKLGYGFAYRVLDAQYIRTFSLPWAVPQRRRRVFVVGYLGDWRPAAAVLFDGQSLRGDPPPRREAGQRVAPTLAARTRGGGGLGTDFDVDGGLIPSVANPLTARMHKGVNTTMDEGQTMVAHALRAEGFDASEDGTGRGTPIVPVAFDIKSGLAPHGAASVSDAAFPLKASDHKDPQLVVFDSKASQPQALEDGTSPTLRAMNHSGSHANAGGQLAVAFDAQAGGNTGLAHSSEVAGALHGGGKHGGRAAVAFDMRGREGGAMPEGPHDPANIRAASGGSSRSYVAFAQNQRDELRTMDAAGALAAEPGMKQQTFIASRWAVRRLTPKECERLQGFSDGYTDVPYRGRNHTPDGPRYKALGNSMACNAMEWIGQRIQHVREIMAEAGS